VKLILLILRALGAALMVVGGAIGAELAPPSNQVGFCSLIVGWDWPEAPGVEGFNLYWGPPGHETNRVWCLANRAIVRLPLGQQHRMFVRSVSGTLESSNSNLIHWPPLRVLQVSGRELQCRPALNSAHWVRTNSTWRQTNVTGSMFFRSVDLHGPAYTNWMD
jgi:hypothetical protein